MRKLQWNIELVRNELLGRAGSDLQKAVHKFGRGPSMGTGLATVWSQNNLLTYLAAAQVLKLSSSDVKDDVAGVGVRTVEVFGVDADYGLVSEVVEMDGQLESLTTVEFLRVFRINAKSWGSELDNAGTVYVGDGVVGVGTGIPATIYGTMEPGTNRSQLGFYTIPAGFSGFVHRAHLSLGASAKEALGGLFVRDFGLDGFELRTNWEAFENYIDDRFILPLPISEKADVEMRLVSSTGTVPVSCGFEICLIANTGL